MESYALLVIVVLLVSLIVGVSYLLTLQRALKVCAPTSRTMKPGMVWLMFIPVFGLVWQFVIVMNLTKSLGNEFRRLGIPCPEPTLGRNIGLTNCACSCCLVFLPLVGRLLPFLILLVLLGRLFAAIIGLLTWIAYWNRITDYSRILDAQQAMAPASPLS